METRGMCIPSASETDATHYVPPPERSNTFTLQQVFDLGEKKLSEFFEYWRREVARSRDAVLEFQRQHPEAKVLARVDARFGMSPRYLGLGYYGPPVITEFHEDRLSEADRVAYRVLCDSRTSAEVGANGVAGILDVIRSRAAG